MCAESEKPNIIGLIWMKYWIVTKSICLGRRIWPSLRAIRLHSPAGSVNSGRHFFCFTMRRTLRKRRVSDIVPSCVSNIVSLRLWLKGRFHCPLRYPLAILEWLVSFCSQTTWFFKVAAVTGVDQSQLFFDSLFSFEWTSETHEMLSHEEAV